MILRSRRTRVYPSKQTVATPNSTLRSLRPRSALRARAASRGEAVVDYALQSSDEESSPQSRSAIRTRAASRGKVIIDYALQSSDEESSPRPRSAIRTRAASRGKVILDCTLQSSDEERSPWPRSAIRTRAASRGKAVIESDLQYSDEESILLPRSAKRTRAASRGEAIVECALQFSDEENIPPVAKCPKIKLRDRRRATKAQDSETTDVDFKTPVRGRQLRVHFQDNCNSLSPNPAVRNIYSPIVRFLTPLKTGVQSPGCELLSPEQCVFGYDALSPLSDEETNEEAFNPYAFIKNIPSHSQQSRPCVRDIPVKTRSTPEATLVLDLDETLVFSTLNHLPKAEYTFHTSFQNHKYKVSVIMRPHVQQFLQRMSKIFEMFVYTSAKRDYAEQILDILDPQKKIFRHRLYQEDCFCILGHYVKDLGLLQRDLAKTVVLDNAPHTFPYHVMNMIPIPSWTGEKDDKELIKLIPYLEKLSEAEDFRRMLKRRADHLHRLLSED
ncbi:hypothetical protein GJAV_G00110580 [Gymnothorax javanicus]|nr:hypothetical protein GJAV_G00110580 [Gymnothorax javanicus]